MHFHIGLKAFSCGPEMGTFLLTGWAARDRTKLGGEATERRGLAEGRGGLEGLREEVEG